MDEIKPTEETIKYIQYLSEILDFGTSELQTKVNSDKHSHLQNFLLFSFIPIHNYSEAILTLCKNSRPHASNVLLRSIFEAYMNIMYVKSTDTEKRLALFAKGSFKGREKLLKRFTELSILYPHLKDKYAILEKDNLISHKEFVDKHIQAIDLGNDLNEDDNYEEQLLERIKQIDKEAPKDKAGMNEFNYRTMYSLLSQYTHLSPWGLELFIKQGSKSIIYTLGQDVGGDEIIGQTYLFYFELLLGLYENKVLSGEMPIVYRTWFDEFKKGILK